MKTSTLLASLLFTLASAAKRACTQAEIALATGIHLNIQGQYVEYNGTLNVIKAETEHPRRLLAIALAKGALQSEIQAGMNLRQFNQQIAPEGNPVIPGLKKYEDAQATEKAQVDGLTGFYSKDKEVLEKLLEEVKGGIKLNEGNLADATSLCDFTLVFPPANEMGS